MGRTLHGKASIGGRSSGTRQRGTLAQLTDPARRPELPRAPIHANSWSTILTNGWKCVRTFGHDWRASSGDSSSESDSEAFTAFARTLAVGEVPHKIVKAIWLGRMTALRKPDGGVWGIVVGDFLRRLVAHTLAQQFSKAFLEATTPFQFALSTKAGRDPRVANIDEFGRGRNSVDGVGAFDLISRNAMVSGLMAMDKLWPFVRQFYGQPSSRLWDHPRHCSSVWVCT